MDKLKMVPKMGMGIAIEPFERTDCFAFMTSVNGGRLASCSALNDLACEGCSFYKSRRQWLKEQGKG